MILLVLACSLVPSSEGDTSPVDSGAPADSGETDDTQDTGPSDQEVDDARVRALTDLPEGDSPCAEPLLVRIDYVVDGDTFYCSREDDGSSVKVRMIGVDTPEIEHDDPAECFGNEAWTYTAQQLENQLAWLTFDADCLDDYDRTLAYVFRDTTEAGFFNRNLARNGYADQLTIAPNDSFEAEIASDISAAQREDLGMWGECS